VKASSALRLVLFAALFCSGGCSFFSHQPPLPRQARVETGGGDETFVKLVESADIIYFPVESFALLPRSGAAWKLLEALKRNGDSFAVGWDTAAGDERVRRALLIETGKSGAQVLSLHEPSEAAVAEMSVDVIPPPEDFERFARRFSSRGLKEGALHTEYEASLTRQKIAAEKIASYFKEHRGEKVLVFLRRDEVGSDYGVPYFVAQKTKARQLILNPRRQRESAGGLLAWD
jgi:hypothetical protein